MLSDRLTEKIKIFIKSQVIDLNGEEALEFKRYYQQKYRDTPNLSCGLCMASCFKKVIRDENI